MLNQHLAFFQHVHKAIEREAERVLAGHQPQFFFLISWFLKAERARRKTASAKGQQQERGDAQESPFALIAGVLTQPIFITLNRLMQSSYDMHEWLEIKAAMRCFTQIVSAADPTNWTNILTVSSY